jgi:Zn-finger nucleic acid-binding protein
MSARQNIEIDYCPQCRGVWLDRGELDKLIERSVQEAGGGQAAAPVAAAAPAPQGRPYRDDDHHGRYHGGHDKGYRKKSFWHEIFD